MLTDLQKQEIVWLLTSEASRRGFTGTEEDACRQVAQAYCVTEEVVRGLVRASRQRLRGADREGEARAPAAAQSS